MTTTDSSTTLRMSSAVLWVLRIGCGTLGLGLGFLVKPLVQWFIDLLGEAPGPLRLAATLPTAWAVPVLAVVGLVAGSWLAAEAQKESLELTIDEAGVRLKQNGAERYLHRAEIDAVFQDRKDLVFLDATTRQLARHKSSDLSKTKVRAAFERLGYPWAGTSDPHENEFSKWLDGHPGLDDQANALFRARARALTDKQRGAAADLADQLQAIGVVLRDREETQQYRRIPGPRDT
ncbi:YqeB family protein [Saccharopolyspora sp. 5N708]|uniref:YqeB family protein n=1 Tax=Saccharopolyspora sp. 5N708 TaxID=3457424 RepID=UPI003FD059C6